MSMLKLKRNLFSAMLLLPVLAVAAPDSEEVACPEVKLQLEQLPDLNIRRASHTTFFVNGELVVAGGHTSGFVPTPTAEYYKDGEWHVMDMVYTHDFGGSVVLKSGKVLLFGGSEKPIGIGQTFLAELYDPLTHTFDGFGCMERKRAGTTGLELDSGQVVITGNWYHDDGIEVFDGHKSFSYLKDVTVERSTPYILRTAHDNALIFGTQDIKANPISYVADFLKGDSVSIPLFETWHPLAISHHRMEDSFIGDETKELYAYLIPVADSTGQVAIAKVENGIFSLLPTVCPIPMQSQGETIAYGTQIVVDQKAGRAYLLGISGDFHSTPDEPDRLFLVCIDYAEATDDKPAPLTLYYTDPIMDVPDNAPVLDADGNLLLAGGLLHNSNFTPSGAVWRLCVGKKPVAQSENSRWPMALLILVALLAVCACVYIIIKKRRQRPAVNTDSSELMSAEAFTQLMERINQAMESKKLYQNSDLKVNDLAAALGTNRRTVSDCINSQKGCNFTQFVNIYRVEHAKRVMRQNPDKKIADIYIESGFANEGSFFRTFKAVTGMTPKEWLSKA